jgi:uncharacterized protein (DUF2141 family)
MKKLSLLSISIFLFLPCVAMAQLATLSISVEGIEPVSGTIEVSLFNTADLFMKEPFLQSVSVVESDEAIKVEFSGLLEGDYAVVVVHDENDNGVLDTGFLGFGGESFAFSNDAKPWIGRPSFEEAAITVGTDDLEIVINLD